MNSLSNKRRDEISVHLRELASKAWHKTSGGVWQIALDFGANPQNRIDHNHLSGISDDLKKSGLKEIFHLKNGTRGRVYSGQYDSGQQVVVRHGKIEAGSRS